MAERITMEEVDDGQSMRQALVTVTRLQKAAREHVTVMIPGEWKRAATPTHPDPRTARTS